MKYKRIIFVVILLIVAAMELFAGGRRRIGAAGAQELLIPVGGRGTALGGSFLSSINGVEAIYWNPAGVSGMNSSAEAMFSTMNYIADVGVNAFAIAGNFKGFGTIGFSVKVLSFGDIIHTDEYNPDGLGETFSPNYTTVGFTYSNALTDRVRIGLTANIVNEKIMSTGASGVSFDAGIQYSGLAGINGLKVGIALKNLGPQMKYDGSNLFRFANADGTQRGSSLMKVDAAGFELPSCFELGVGYEALLTQDHRAVIGTSFQNNNFSDDEYKFSFEYSFQNLVFIRASYQIAPQAPTNTYLYGPAFGAGLHYNTGGVDLNFDYAYRTNDIFDASHIITLKIGF